MKRIILLAATLLLSLSSNFAEADPIKPAKSSPDKVVSGTKKWEFLTGGGVVSSPVIGTDGTVYVGSGDRKLYAIDGKTGIKKWEFLTGDMVFSSPAIGADGTVYMGSDDKKLYAIDGKTGTKKWEFFLAGYYGNHSSPTIGADGTVYMGSEDKKLYAIDGKTGTKKWEFLTGDWVTSSPAIGADGTVYVGSIDKKLYAIDGKTGTKKWEFLTGGMVNSPAIGADGTVYVGSSPVPVTGLVSFTGELYAIDGKTGTKKWEFKTGGPVSSRPAIGADGTVYIGSHDRKLYAIDGKTGTKKWEFLTGGKVNSPAIGADGTVYVGSIDEKLYAIDGKTGSKKWAFLTGNRVYSSPAIGADGTVYVGSGPFTGLGFPAGKLYAIRSAGKGPVVALTKHERARDFAFEKVSIGIELKTFLSRFPKAYKMKLNPSEEKQGLKGFALFWLKDEVQAASVVRCRFYDDKLYNMLIAYDVDALKRLGGGDVGLGQKILGDRIVEKFGKPMREFKAAGSDIIFTKEWTFKKVARFIQYHTDETKDVIRIVIADMTVLDRLKAKIKASADTGF